MNTNKRHAPIAIRAAASTDLDELTGLFEAYRRFYELEPDADSARAFLADRLKRTDSVILVAEDERDHTLVGFVQLYPTFSSLRMGRALILNDLYVVERYRRAGVARKLSDAVLMFARMSGAVSVSLETQRANTKARALYESLGYHAEEDFITYSVTVSSA